MRDAELRALMPETMLPGPRTPLPLNERSENERAPSGCLPPPPPPPWELAVPGREELAVPGREEVETPHAE